MRWEEYIKRFSKPSFAFGVTLEAEIKNSAKCTSLAPASSAKRANVPKDSNGDTPFLLNSAGFVRRRDGVNWSKVVCLFRPYCLSLFSSSVTQTSPSLFPDNDIFYHIRLLSNTSLMWFMCLMKTFVFANCWFK